MVENFRRKVSRNYGAVEFSKFKPFISSFLEIDFEINISDRKSRRFDLSEVIFKCIKVL